MPENNCNETITTKMSSIQRDQTDLSPTFHRFTDLPQEVIDMIINHYYESYDLEIWSDLLNLKRLNISGLPPTSLALVSRHLHASANPILRKAFSGCLTVHYLNDRGLIALKKLCTRPASTWLQNEVQTLNIVSFERARSRILPFTNEEIHKIVTCFPKLEEISLRHKLIIRMPSLRYMEEKRSAMLFNWGNHGHGAGDGMSPLYYTFTVRRSRAAYLARALAIRGKKHVKVIVVADVNWVLPDGCVLLAEMSQVYQDMYCVYDSLVRANFRQGTRFEVTDSEWKESILKGAGYD